MTVDKDLLAQGIVQEIIQLKQGWDEEYFKLVVGEPEGETVGASTAFTLVMPTTEHIDSVSYSAGVKSRLRIINSLHRHCAGGITIMRGQYDSFVHARVWDSVVGPCGPCIIAPKTDPALGHYPEFYIAAGPDRDPTVPMITLFVEPPSILHSGFSGQVVRVELRYWFHIPSTTQTIMSEYDPND